MKKRFTIIPLILITVLIFSPTLFAESIELNLEKAYQFTLEDNTSLKIAQKDLDNKEIQYQKAKAENLMNQSNYSELRAEYNLAAAKNSYIETANNLLRETLQQYTEILLKDKNIETLNKQIILNENRLNEVEAQYEVGEKSQLDILEQQIKLNDLIQEREQLKNEYEQLKTEFKVKLGSDKDIDLQLVELDQPEYLNLEEKEIQEQALTNSWNLKLTKLNYELTKTDQKRKEVTSSSEMDKKITDNQVEIAELELDKQKQNIENRARELSNQINNIKNNIELHRDKIKSARETYEILKEQNKSGLITDNELYEGEISLLQSEYQLYNSYMQYHLQAQNIKQFMNPNSGVLEDEK
jgi:outer membrane protein TolC